MPIPPSAIPFFQRNGYIPQKNLGQGAGGALKKKKKVAIKVIHRKESISTGPKFAPSYKVTLLEKVQWHPNIIQLYGVEMTEDFVLWNSVSRLVVGVH